MPDKNNSVPLGKPLELTDDELDDLATVTPDDIQKARRLWIKSNPDLASLLDTTEVVEE